MDFVKNIFNIKTNNLKSGDSTSKFDSPLTIIEEQIKLLENINLSPLPNSRDDVINQKNEVSTILKKIVFNFDYILSDKLKLTDKNMMNHSNTSEDIHYWNYLSKYFQIPSVKFINIYDQLQYNSEKGLSWIYISILEKSLHETIKDIYSQSFHRKYYQDDSMMITKRQEIIYLSEKICKAYLFEITSDIWKEYENYKQIKKNEAGNNYEIDFPTISPISKRINNKNLITPFTLELRDAIKDNANIYQSKATLDLNSRMESNNLEKGATVDNLFKLISTDGDDINFNYDKEDEEDIDIIREKSIPKNTQIIFHNVIGARGTMGDKRQEEKIASNLKHWNRQMNNETVNVCKYIDMQNCYKEDFFNFSEPKENANPNAGSYTLTINNVPSTVGGTATHQPLNLNRNKSNETVTQKGAFIPFDKDFRISRKVDKNSFSKKDIIYYKNKEIKLTNSIVFYLNYFYKKENYIRFKTEITSSRPITIESQNYQCNFCKKIFKMFLHIPLSKIYWCSYYMRFICDECVSDEYSIIPGFVLKQWNFNKFSISKKGKEFLALWYDKPVIYIKKNDPIIKESTLLHAAIIMKRKINKIFDLMKCDSADKFVLETLKNHKYLVLREIMFSLKDLVDINEMKMMSKLSQYFKIMEDHILNDCEVCKYKGGQCVMCMNDEIIYAYDIENVLYCNVCKKLFHKRCCSFHPCIINQ